MTDKEKQTLEQQAKLVHLNEDSALVMSNKLVEANYSLSLAEQKVMIAIIAQIDDFDATDFNICKVSISELAQRCGYSASRHALRNISIVTDKIMSRVLTIHLENGKVYKTHWVQSCLINPEEGYVIYRLDESLKPELLQLKRAFLKVRDSGQLMQFSSFYSTRFYLLFKQYAHIGWRAFTPEALIEIFDLPKSYRLFAHLREKVIEVAVKELNEKTSLNVSVEYERGGGRGRKVTKIIFRFAKKSTEDALEDAGQGRIIDEYGNALTAPSYAASVGMRGQGRKPRARATDKAALDDAERDAARRMVDNYNFSEADAVSYLKRFGYAYCTACMEYTRIGVENGKVKNPGGFLRSALDADYPGQYKVNKEAAGREEQARQDNIRCDNEAKAFFNSLFAAEREEKTELTELEKWERKRGKLRTEAWQKLRAEGITDWEEIQKAIADGLAKFDEKYPRPQDGVEDEVENDVKKNGRVNKSR